jgi:hypothetical protein
MFDPTATGRLALQTHTASTASDDRRLAYIKAMRSEEVAFLFAEAPLLAPGHQVFVLCAEDGTPILLADSHAAAEANALSQRIETVSLH